MTMTKKAAFLVLLILTVKTAISQAGSATCSTPSALTVDPYPIGTAVLVTWNSADTVTGYQYAIDTNPVPPAQGTATTETGAVVYGIVINVQYYLHVRSACGSSFSDWASMPFVSQAAPPPANDEITGAVDVPIVDACTSPVEGTTLSATSSPTQPFPSCGDDAAGHDDDVWFKFTPVSGQFFARIDFNFLDGDIGLVAQIYTSSNNTASGTLSLFACSDDEGPGALPGFYHMPVTPGKTYFIRVFTTNQQVWSEFSVCIRKSTLVNDDASGAILVKVDQPCTTAKYHNLHATQATGEPFANCSGTAGNATAWYKFIAPPSGIVKISTAYPGGTLLNSRIAVFSATNVNDYSTFTILSCDENSGPAGALDAMSILYAAGLTPEATYYIQVDKANASDADGTFCLTVETLKPAMLSTNSCGSTYQVPLGLNTSYNGWVSLLDNESRLVAMVRNPAGAMVGGYSVSQNIYPGVVRKDPISNEYYLNRSFLIKNAVSGAPIDIRLFFLTSELNALKGVDKAAELYNLRATAQAATTCRPDFVAGNGTNVELPQAASGGANGVNWIAVNTSVTSNFYIHATKSFVSAKVFLQGAFNPPTGRHKDVTPNWANILNTYAKNQPYNTTIREGYGSGTAGGKGHPVVHVTNLNATGPGSLVEAMGSNRTIVFDVGGTIENFNWEDYGVYNLTIDGSTAPPPGITLNNNGLGDCLSFLNGCHDIIVRNIRVRNAGNDGINVVESHDIVFDHVSSGGNADGDLDITQGSYNITVQWSIFGHGAAGAMLIAYSGTKNISIHHNLFNSTGPGHGERNPFVHNAGPNLSPTIVSYLMADFRNNLVWKWGDHNGENFGFGSGVGLGGTLQAVNNFYQSVASPEHALFRDHDSLGSKIYAAGNISGNSGINPNAVGNMAAPWAVAPVVTESPCVSSAKILAQAGPRPLDSLDAALINGVSLDNCPGAPNPISIIAGSEGVSGQVFSSNPASTTDILDWILLEIKDASGVIKAKRAAFVREDGQIVDLDGVSPVSMYGLASGMYNLTVRHRNHIGIRTSSLQTFDAIAMGSNTAGVLTYDFTTSQDKVYQNPAITSNPAMAQNGSTHMMWAGDPNTDGYGRLISQAFPFISSDVSYIFTTMLNSNINGLLSGYSIGDVNMDGNVRVISQAFPFIPSESSFLVNTVFNNNILLTIQEHK